MLRCSMLFDALRRRMDGLSKSPFQDRCRGDRGPHGESDAGLFIGKRCLYIIIGTHVGKHDQSRARGKKSGLRFLMSARDAVIS